MDTTKLEHRDEPPSELISGVLSDARDLAVAEVDKIKAEAFTQVKVVGEDIKIASLTFLIFTVAAVMAGAAIALGLFALGLPAWLGFAIAAVAFAIAGAVVFSHRRRG